MADNETPATHKPNPRKTRSDANKPRAPKMEIALATPPRSPDVVIAAMEERIDMLDGAIPEHVPGHAKRLADLLRELKKSVNQWRGQLEYTVTGGVGDLAAELKRAVAK